MRGKKSDLGRNNTKNWEIRSFWSRYTLKWGITGQFTELPAREKINGMQNAFKCVAKINAFIFV